MPSRHPRVLLVVRRPRSGTDPPVTVNVRLAAGAEPAPFWRNVRFMRFEALFEALNYPHDQSGTQGTRHSALAQVTTRIIKLPMKIRRQCGRCGDFNSVLVEPGQAVPAFKCSACGYPAG